MHGAVDGRAGIGLARGSTAGIQTARRMHTHMAVIVVAIGERGALKGRARAAVRKREGESGLLTRGAAMAHGSDA
jgi:hypothetical protein